MEAASKVDIEEMHWKALQSWKKEAVEFTEILDLVPEEPRTAGCFPFPDLDDLDNSGSSNASLSRDSCDSAEHLHLHYYRDLIERIQSGDFEPCPVEKLFDDDAPFHIVGDVGENTETGERYLRIVVREWYREKQDVDPMEPVA